MSLVFPWWVLPVAVILMLTLASSVVIEFLRLRATSRSAEATTQLVKASDEQMNLLTQISNGIDDIITLMGGNEDFVDDPDESPIPPKLSFPGNGVGVDPNRPVITVPLPDSAPSATSVPYEAYAPQHSQPVPRRTPRTIDSPTAYMDPDRVGRGWDAPGSPGGEAEDVTYRPRHAWNEGQ